MISNYNEIIRRPPDIIGSSGEEIWNVRSRLALVRLKQKTSSVRHFHAKALETYIIIDGLPWYKRNDNKPIHLNCSHSIVVAPNVFHQFGNDLQKDALLWLIRDRPWIKEDVFYKR